MATLSNEDFHEIKKIIRQDPVSNQVFKELSLSRYAWENTFQAAEDWFVDGFNTPPPTSFKAAVEVHAGALTGFQTKEIGYVWMAWRSSKKP